MVVTTLYSAIYHCWCKYENLKVGVGGSFYKSKRLGRYTFLTQTLNGTRTFFCWHGSKLFSCTSRSLLGRVLTHVFKVSKGYFKTARGYVIYSPRAQPEVNKSRAHLLIYHMGEVDTHLTNKGFCSIHSWEYICTECRIE